MVGVDADLLEFKCWVLVLGFSAGFQWGRGTNKGMDSCGMGCDGLDWTGLEIEGG